MFSPITLKELAQLLHLDPSTVSRALKGHPDISLQTQQKVRMWAERLHYKPNDLASGLRNRKSNLLAIVIPDLTDSYYTQVTSAIIQAAYQQNYKTLIFESNDNYEQEAAICFSLLKSGVDGLLIAPSIKTRDIEHLKNLQENLIPLVVFGRILGELNSDRVAEDDFGGAFMAVSHMIQGGCTHIAHFACPQQILWAQKRQMGYIQALQSHHLPIDRNLIMEFEQLEELDQLTEQLIKIQKIDGIFVANDEGAVKTMYLLQQKGYHIPQQIAICGFGNLPLSTVTCPPLTSVDRHARQIGEKALELMIRRLTNKNKNKTETHFVRNELIIRQSTLQVKPI